MPETIPNLWPDDFKVDVRSPYSILKVQAEQLGRATRGILRGEVESETNQKDVQHRLVVVAPAYNNYRQTLVAAIHNAKLPYPTEIRALGRLENTDQERLFIDEVEEEAEDEDDVQQTIFPTAYDDTEVIKYVSEALRSGPTRSLIISLIAKSTEAAIPNG